MYLTSSHLEHEMMRTVDRMTCVDNKQMSEPLIHAQWNIQSYSLA